MNPLIEIDALRHQLLTQDNRSTADPFFAVQEKRRCFGLSGEYTDLFTWIDEEEGHEVDRRKASRLEKKYQQTLEVTKGFRRVGYVEYWDFVTGCFTEAGCKRYIEINRHNHRGELRIYAYSLFRNKEMIGLRTLLMQHEDKDKFFIVCTGHKAIYPQGAVLFWAPNKTGYTSDINYAGRYSKEEATDIHSPENGAFAIPCSAVVGHTRSIVDYHEHIKEYLSKSKKLFGKYRKVQHA